MDRYKIKKASFENQIKTQEEWIDCEHIFPIGALLYCYDSDVVKCSNGVDIYKQIPVYCDSEVGIRFRDTFIKQLENGN